MSDHDTHRPTDRTTPLRIGDAERQRMVDTLQEHVSAGRLDMAEFERRVEHATGAVYDRDLEGLLDDLPPIDGDRTDDADPRRSRRPGTDPGRRAQHHDGWGPWSAGGGWDPRRGARRGVPWPLLAVGAVALIALTHGWILLPLLFLAVATGRGPCAWGPGGHPRRSDDSVGSAPPWRSHGHAPGEARDEDPSWDRPVWPGRYDPDADDRSL